MKWMEVVRLLVSESAVADTAPLYTEGIVTPIGDLHKGTTFIQNRQIIDSIEVLFELANQGDPLQSAVEQLQSLAASEGFQKHVHELTDRSERTRAACLLIILAYRPGGVAGVPGVAPLAKTEISNLLHEPPKGLTDAFTDLLARHKRLGLLFDMLDDLPGADAFVSLCLQYIAKEKIEHARMLFTPERFVSRYSDIRRSLQKNESSSVLMDILIKHLGEGPESPLLEYVRGGSLDPDLTSFYGDLYRAYPDKDLKDWCYRELGTVQQAMWEKALRTEDGYFDLLYRLDAPTEGKELGEAFTGALLACAQEMVEGQLAPEYPPLWHELPGR